MPRDASFQRLRGPAIAILLALVGGTVGYMLLEGWSLDDALFKIK